MYHGCGSAYYRWRDEYAVGDINRVLAYNGVFMASMVVWPNVVGGVLQTAIPRLPLFEA